MEDSDEEHQMTERDKKKNKSLYDVPMKKYASKEISDSDQAD